LLTFREDPPTILPQSQASSRSNKIALRASPYETVDQQIDGGQIRRAVHKQCHGIRHEVTNQGGSKTMQSKPLIGLNADYRGPQHDAPAFSYLAAGYYDSITQVGGVPIVVPPLEEESDIEEVLKHLDGFVFVGGQDLDPRRDGFMLHPTVRPLEARRETFDRKLMRMIADRRLPVFGIGVGMQLLNVSQGGNLFLHILEDLPTAIPHKDHHDPAHRHGLEVVPGSLMERVYGDGEIRVNSMHHMAVDEVAPGFAVTARCPDGVIEAIESVTEDWFAVGTQFHPEAGSASALDVRIFEEFLDGAKEQHAALRLVA
jgi:putative glutamine amidotransferase